MVVGLGHGKLVTRIWGFLLIQDSNRDSGL